jgi:hypothetical protein
VAGAEIEGFSPNLARVFRIRTLNEQLLSKKPIKI